MRYGIILLIMIGGFGVSVAAERSRPMADMQGDCSNYRMDLRKVFQIWEKPSESVAEGKSPLSFGKRVSLGLKPQASVSFVQPPAKEFPLKGERHAGVFMVRAESAGVLSIASGSKVWFDLVEGSSKKIIETAEFEMQTKCDKIVKVVKFPVAAKTDYVFQVSSSMQPQADFVFLMQK